MVAIRASREADFPVILALINTAAQAYRGVIPADRWREPYMPADELRHEIDDGVSFWIAEQDDVAVAVMGLQDKGEVVLVRHAYVAPRTQRLGVGKSLLRHVQQLSSKPVLVGTWADASWAIAFYRRNGFTLLPMDEKDALLKKYWSVPERQMETSVVLADERWGKGRQL